MAIQSLLVISPGQNDAEIIVVDNNTSDELSADLLDFCRSLSDKVRYVREASPGLSAARHRGAEESRGELLTFIDDDVEVSFDWLKAIQKGFADPAVAMVGGPSIPKFTCSIPSWFWDFMDPTSWGGWSCGWLSLLDIGQDVPNINPNYIWGLNFSIRKSVMLACGGFHTDLVPAQYQRWQGDGESGLTMKAQSAGYRADYLKDVMLHHLCGPDRLNLEYFKKRAYYQGVCDSFTQIRQGVEHTAAPHQRRDKTSLYRRVRRVAGRTWRGFKGQTQTEAVSPWANEGAEVKLLTRQAYQNGWSFHQREVAADPALLAWVRRENYFGTDLRSESAAWFGNKKK